MRKRLELSVQVAVTEGGGSEVLVVDVLPFDTKQITSDKNWSHPRYGDPCHPLAVGQHPPHVVIEVKDEDCNGACIHSTERRTN